MIDVKEKKTGEEKYHEQIGPKKQTKSFKDQTK